MALGNLFSSNNLISGIAAATTAAGTSTVTGATFDMQGYEGICFVAKFGTAATDNTLKAAQGALSDMSDAADLLGTSVGVGSSDETVWLDIYQPRERYVRCLALRGTSTTLDACMAFQYGARTLPVDNTTAGTIHGEAHVSPAEGTA